MTQHPPALQPYPGVAALLSDLLSSVRALLGDRLVGAYLYGSLALSAFRPDHSDVDILFVLDGELGPEQLSALQDLHRRVAASPSPWATELECAYIPQDDLRRYDHARARHPHLDRGGSSLRIEQHDVDWVIQRYVVREHGITLTGPDPKELIDPITADDLRQALKELMRIWWTPMAVDPARIQSESYRAYAVLTMCRILYTRRHGSVISKPAATKWARTVLDPGWHSLIDRALAGKMGDDLLDTQSLIRLVATAVDGL